LVLRGGIVAESKLIEVDAPVAEAGYRLLRRLSMLPVVVRPAGKAWRVQIRAGDGELPDLLPSLRGVVAAWLEAEGLEQTVLVVAGVAEVVVANRAGIASRRGQAGSEATTASVAVFTRFDLLVHGLLTVVNVAALVFGTFYWFGQGRLSSASFWVLSLLLVPGLAMAELRWLALPLMRRPLPPPPEPGLRIAAVTTFVPDAESFEMLELTLRALVALDYPHDTWVLDEGDDPEVRALCGALGVSHFSRRRLTEYRRASGRYQAASKHGNYNAWLSEHGFDRYDVVVTFDPDHIPRRQYLTRVLGYFRDRSVAYVQPAQVYYNQPASFIARGAAEETYAFYSSVLMANFAIGFPLVIGCHTAHRMEALRALDGLAPHDADDLLLTLRYLAARWRGVYVPEPLAAGLTPVDWAGYLKQQRRWARSVLDIKLRAFPKLWRALPARVAVAAGLHGFAYLQGLLIPIGLLFLCYVLASGDIPVPLGPDAALRLFALWAALTLCDFYRQRFYLLRREEIGFHWRAILLKFAKWPALSLALLDLVRRRRPDYELTDKIRRRRKSPRLLLLHLAAALAIATTWAIGSLRHTNSYPLLDVVAGLACAFSLGIVASQLIRFPAPFNPRLALNVLDRSASRDRALAAPPAP
jgi:Glycosyltransferase like family 2